MSSPLLVVDVANSLPSWNEEGDIQELGLFVRTVRGALFALNSGERGSNVARVAFNHRKEDPQDPEKRPDFDEIPAQERAWLVQVGGHVQAEAVLRGLISEIAGGNATIKNRK